MITDINGNPYTTAQEDIHIQQLGARMQKDLHGQIQRALYEAKDGKLEIDSRIYISHFQAAYAMGRAYNGNTKKPTAIEIKHFSDLLSKAQDVLAGQIQGALSSSEGGSTSITLTPMKELLFQAYYLGRDSA